MASFVHLPVELKEAIIAVTPFRDLASLSRTCRGIRCIALPHLFHTIALTCDATSPADPPISALLRSLLANPALAQHVKSLELSACNYEVFARKRRRHNDQENLLPFHTRNVMVNDHALFEEALESCKWMPNMDAARDGNLFAVIALLLSRCTQLEFLRVDVELLLRNQCFPAMFKNTFSCFDKLAQIAITCSAPDTTYSYSSGSKLPLDTFLILFYLPKIQKLDLALFPDLEMHWHTKTMSTNLNTPWPFPSPPTPSRLTSLRITRSLAPPDTLGFLLERTPNLTKLDYYCLLPSSETPLDCTILRQALDCIRPTVEHLWLRCDIFANEAIEVEELVEVCAGSLGSLHDFHSLTVLNSSLAILYGQGRAINSIPLADLVPPHLHHLTINDDLWGFTSFPWDGLEVLEVLRKFLVGQRKVNASWNDASDQWEVAWADEGEPMWKAMTPELRVFELDMRERGWSFYDVWDEPSHRVSLQQAVQNQGLKCRVLYMNNVLGELAPE